MARENIKRVENITYEGGGSIAPTSRQAAYPRFDQAYNSGPEKKWQIEIQNRLIELARMEDNWDSYGSSPMGWDTGMFALSILNDVMRPRTPIPQVVPSSTGGVQLEWHEKGVDLELHIAGPYQCEFWFQDHRKPNEPPVCLELTDDFSALLKPIELLTSR
jgi:hypothetical protein